MVLFSRFVGLTLFFATISTFSFSQKATLPVKPNEQQVQGTVESNPEIRRGIVWDENNKKPRNQRFLERRLRNIEPELIGKPERLESYLYFFKTDLVNDTNLILFDVSAKWNEDQSTVILSGYAEFEQNVEALLLSLQILGFTSVENQIELLPSKEFKKKPVGIVIVPQELVYNKPVQPRETMTDGVMGDTFFLLKTVDDMILAHAPDGYICYISKDAVKPMSSKEYREYKKQPFFTSTMNISVGDLLIPPGATIALKPIANGDYAMVNVEGEEIGPYLPSYGEIASSTNSQALEAIQIAKTFLGTPYVWGGKSTSGVDCSGLVQSSYRALGYNLPRDAYMQAYMGRLSATPATREFLEAGDLLYFMSSTGRISHTAIYIADDVYIEAVDGGVKYTSFDSKDTNFDEDHLKSFCFAKRFVE